MPQMAETVPELQARCLLAHPPALAAVLPVFHRRSFAVPPSFHADYFGKQGLPLVPEFFPRVPRDPHRVFSPCFTIFRVSLEFEFLQDESDGSVPFLLDGQHLVIESRQLYSRRITGAWTEGQNARATASADTPTTTEIIQSTTTTAFSPSVTKSS